jgi:uncharacterized delta-60 repeat protein
MRRRCATAAVSVLAMTGLLTGPAAAKVKKHVRRGAQSGTVQTKTGPFSSAGAVAIQPDGKIVAAGVAGSERTGHALVIRYLANGRIDPGFGKVKVFGGAPSGATDLAIQPDGKILVAVEVKGRGPSSDGFSADFGLVRLLPTGALDSSFGLGGMVRADLGADDIPLSLSLLPDGRALLAGGSDYGYPDHANPDCRFATARFTPDGSPDPSWGGGTGKVVTTFDRFTHALTAHVAADGTTTVAGLHSLDPGGPGFTDVAIARYDPAGGLDGSFGTGGRLVVPFSSSTQQRGPKPDDGMVDAAIFTPDGRLVVAGDVSWTGGKRGERSKLIDQTWIRRFETSGTPDPTFGGDGIAAFDLFRFGGPTTLETTPAGATLLGGTSPHKGAGFEVTRFGPLGSPDRSFGRRGTVVTRFPGLNDRPSDLAVDQLGRVIAVGFADPKSGVRFALARYLPNGKLDRSFGRRRHSRKPGKH